MKKLTLFKLLLVGAMFLAAAYTESAAAFTCPPDCFHLTCGNGDRAHCNSEGQCVCP